MADAAHQFYRVKRMEYAWVTRDDKSDGGVLNPTCQTLGRRVRPEFQVTYDRLDTLGDLFIDGGNLVQDSRDGGDGYIRLAGDISYAYFFFNHVVIKRRL